MEKPLSVPTPRPSATLVLVREGPAGLEVLLVQRAARGDQNSGAWVFPGGLLDPSDAALHPHCIGPGDATRSQQLALPAGGLSWLAAALRETLEEAGLLLAQDTTGRPLGPADQAHWADWRQRSRSAPHGQAGAHLAALCDARGWRLQTEALHCIAHWITPPSLPKRFDTRFFLAPAPHGQEVAVDGHEIVAHCWGTPQQHLDGGDASRPVKVVGPARAILQTLAQHRSLAQALAWAAKLGPVAPTRPQLPLHNPPHTAP